ncbi:MAG: serine acetyltransferase [Bacteroidales bacterium]|nr:serine acetyltransferase [Bacteroidales bacterium]
MDNNERLRNSINALSALTDDEIQSTVSADSLPSIAAMKRIIELCKHVIFPGYFDSNRIDDQMRLYYIGVSMKELFVLLKQQIACGFRTAGKDIDESTVEDIVIGFTDRLPEIKRMLYTDIDAMSHSDPAVTSKSEIIFCYPFVQVMLHYRVAHELLTLGVPLIPRRLTEMAHSETGIDIHPGARIDEYFCIDHGTGVVIGETCIIGKHVMLYQGVTLGAKSFTFDSTGTPLNTPRHPILEDNVTVYSNSSVLGRITIGHDTIIGGNVWLTNSVPPFSRILQSKPSAMTFTDGAGI